MITPLTLRRLTALTVVALSQGIAASSFGQSIEPGYSVGVAKIDITPNYPIRLHGFGVRRAESDGVTQRIWAKALAIGTDDEKPVILLTVDNLGTRLAVLDEVAARLKEKAGIERQRIALTFSHSHTTPKTTGSADTIFSSPIPPEHQERIDRYTAELTDALEKVALDALAGRKPARLERAVGKVEFAKNRRTEGGPVDHDLPMLVVKSPTDGAIRAIYVTYACHCVTLSDNKISGDWAGYAQEVIERKHPGAIALVSIGCGSDSNPSSGVVGNNIAAAAEQGGEIAADVDRLLVGPLKPVTGRINATLSNIELPLTKLPTRDELEQLAKQDRSQGYIYNAKFQLDKLDRGESLQSAIDYPIQTFVFGDSLAMVFLAGEVCVDYSHRLKDELDASRLWLHGYSNDFCAYIPSERLVLEGGYGGGAETVYFALPSTLKAGLEDKIINEVHRQVPDEFGHQPPGRKSSAAHPWSPEESLAAMQTANELAVELVASEPLVVDPVAIDFSPDGRLWVVEMRDYSRGVEEDFQQSGQISVLTDTNGDGSFDVSIPFVTGLRFPTDVKVWRSGIIVCDAPSVIYMEDTDGDGRADLRTTLLTGFATHNAQARVNSLRWGLDGWLYGSCGMFGGDITSANGDQLALGGRDFRFQPDTGKVEAVTGRTGQGRARDDWQNWFGGDSGTLVDHYPLSEHYQARAPHVAPPADEVFVPAGPDANRLYPRGDLVLFKESGPPGRPTSACGLEIYRDELLGSNFRGNAFVAEPVNQLIHREVLTPRGVTFAGHRAPEEVQREFLASTDQWFRPVQVRTGPDGCLWIVDMHRLVIEHPRFIPEETLRNVDVMAGNTAGRIYRVRPKNVAPRPWLRLDKLETPDLVAALDSPNGPQRDMVQQLLVQRADRAAASLLEKLFATSARPEARLQAIYTLASLRSLRPEMVLSAIRDPHPGVRRHAIQLSEPHLDSDWNLVQAVLALLDDKDSQVQLQLAYSIGQWNDPRAAIALARLAWAHHADPYVMSAVLSSTKRDNAAAVVTGILSRREREFLPSPLVDAVILLAADLGDDSSVREAFIAFSPAREDAVSTTQLMATAKLLQAISETTRRHLFADDANRQNIERLIATARHKIDDENSDEAALGAALQIVFVGARDDDDVRAVIGRMLGANSPPATQQAAVRAVAQTNPDWAADVLLENWPGYTPDVRRHVLSVFFEREPLLMALLAAIQAGKMKPNDLGALERQRLLTHSNLEIRKGVATILSGPINPDRAKVIERYGEVANLSGDSARGREIFAKHCASCHKLDNQGHSVGPDLSALTSRSIVSLVESLFDPNRAIDERYQSYTATTDEGLVHTGLLLRENAATITLLEQQGKERTLLRTSIDDFVNSQISLMPEGLERDLLPQDVADLLTYLAAQGQPPKQFAGNRPTVVEPNQDGVFCCLAANCEIYGQQIIFERPFQNIGYWHDANDHVVWKLNAPEAGRFDVYLDLASSDDSAGDAVLIEGFAAPLRAVVPGTGGYDKYKLHAIGTAELARGANRIIVQSDGPMRRPNLMDLRALYLVPAGKPFDHALAIASEAVVAISNLLEDLAVGTPQEYETIPAIWKVAFAAGKRNDSTELRQLLQLSVPKLDEPAQHWQVVVIGGGIINGLTIEGVWPKQRIHAILLGNEQLKRRWDRLIKLSAAMSDDESVTVGTRYDALRILGTDEFRSSGPQLVKYLTSDSTDLQMGAISALGDIDEDEATKVLIDNFSAFSKQSKDLAIGALSRSEARANALMNSLETATICTKQLTQSQKDTLLRMKDRRLRERAEKVLIGK